MEFKDKFKPGDIICSDRFHYGMCMIVEEGNYGIEQLDRFGYRCLDLIKEDQRWRAYENCSYHSRRSNEWRIATDDDIVKYLARFVEIKAGKVGIYEVLLDDEDIILRDTVATEGYGDVYLNAKELIQLKQIIEERVEV
jgi:hypothetical protein